VSEGGREGREGKEGGRKGGRRNLIRRSPHMDNVLLRFNGAGPIEFSIWYVGYKNRLSLHKESEWRRKVKTMWNAVGDGGPVR